MSEVAPEMKRYRRLRWFAVAILVVECVVGMGGALTKRQEIFPFASWFLFLLVPYHTSDYDLVLRAEGTRLLNPPPPFSQAPGALVQASHSIVAYQLIQQLGEAEKNRDAARSRALRRQIEAQFRVPFIHYDLVKVVYQPVERWQTGRVISRTPMQSFVAGQAQEPVTPVSMGEESGQP